MPPTKYFCRNGYTIRIGTVATMVMAIRTDTGDTAFVIWEAAAWGSIWIIACSIISYSTYCSVGRSLAYRYYP